MIADHLTSFRDSYSITDHVDTHDYSAGAANSLSPSSVRNFLDCPFRWFCRAVLRLPEHMTSNMAIGRAVHAGTEPNFKQKIQSRVDMPIEDAVSFTRDAWRVQLSDVAFRHDEDAKQLGLMAENLTRTYMRNTAPSIQPVGVEKWLSGPIKGVNVRARLDLLLEDGEIVDPKTSGRNPGEKIDHLYRFQLSTYYYLEPSASGKVRLDIITKTKEPKVVPQAFQITDADRQAVETLYPLVQTAMRSGIYLPNRTSLLCSKRQCPHWRYCVKEFGGEVSN